MKLAYKTSLDNIPVLAKEIAKNLKGGEVFALIGELGSGKTTFVKAIGKELGIKKTITSPTFAIINKYNFKLNSEQKYLYHLDLYRTESTKEVLSLGLEEFLVNKKTVVFIEWANKIKNQLPLKTIKIEFIGK